MRAQGPSFQASPFPQSLRASTQIVSGLRGRHVGARDFFKRRKTIGKDDYLFSLHLGTSKHHQMAMYGVPFFSSDLFRQKPDRSPTFGQLVPSPEKGVAAAVARGFFSLPLLSAHLVAASTYHPNLPA